jgi:succinate dehydrogenase / fumarate reductase iron-sulfur subunit
LDSEKWKINLVISRQKGSEPRTFQTYPMDVNPDEYVLDAVERVWAFMDRSLCYRHACHHSTCGACGMLVNGVEKLTCITPIRSMTQDGGTLKVEPLRNFPVVSDLVVDMGSFYLHMDQALVPQVSDIDDSFLPFEKELMAASGSEYERLVDCIECGCCISACPAAHTSETYFGPAVMAGIQHAHNQTHDVALLEMADQHDAIWRCHSAYECSAVCPSNVDPGWRIMDLRKKVIVHRMRGLFGRKEAVK